MLDSNFKAEGDCGKKTVLIRLKKTMNLILVVRI